VTLVVIGASPFAPKIVMIRREVWLVSTTCRKWKPRNG
jgi:hypothetical protein